MQLRPTTERVRRIQDETAPSYDRRISFFERLLFRGRRWVCLGRQAELRLGDDQELEFADESFNNVVCTLGLCTIPDDRRALAAAFRVLRPGGTLLLEHVRSPSRPVRAVQRVLDPFAVHFEADHLLRDPLDHLEGLGFSVETVLRSKLGIVERVAARKPTGSFQVRG